MALAWGSSRIGLAAMVAPSPFAALAAGSLGLSSPSKYVRIPATWAAHLPDLVSAGRKTVMRRSGVLLVLSLCLGVCGAQIIAPASPAAPVIPAASAAAAHDAALKLCFEDTSVYPWITADAKGLAMFEMALVEKELNQKFEFSRLPWRRCLLEVQTGRIHAAIAASFNSERASWGSYPQNPDGSLNREQRLHTDSFHVYRRLDSPVRWLSQRFENIGAQPVGVQLGYSVGRNIEELGYSVKAARSAEDLTRMLEVGALQVVVLQRYEALRLLKAKPELSQVMVEDGPPVKVADQYLLFNSQFYAGNELLVKSIWAAVERARKSKKYQDEEGLMLGADSRVK
jgi:polar amino acid transport system substrate-binding protein